MADRETEILARIGSGVATLDSASWDALAGADPFVSRAFLSALEDSGSVGPGTGVNGTATCSLG
jgi:predicted N-acyltransferase